MTDAVDKLVEILADETSRVWSLKGVSQAILAAIQSDPIAYVKVKPLEWHSSYGVLRAETPYGDYMVARGMLTFPNPMRPQQIHKDEESAQAAATADYHKRLKECFE